MYGETYGEIVSISIINYKFDNFKNMTTQSMFISFTKNLCLLQTAV